MAAHSSKPHLGKNALVAAAQLTKALYAEHESLQSRGGPLGPPTLTPTSAPAPEAWSPSSCVCS